MKNPPHIIVQLIHIHGGMKGQIQEFTDPEISIGRLPSYNLHFPPDEPGVSREHAKILRDGNQFKLITLKDKFGTFVNGRQVKEAVLRNGDVIEFGTGGPKVSFNAEIMEGAAEAEQMPRYQPESSPRADESPGLVDQREAPRQAVMTGGSTPSGTGAVDRMDEPPQRVSAPLIIQFGPTIRTYRELPVVIGKHARCDFVLAHEGIYDQHAQIYFSQNSYWIKDLTGQHLIRVNGRQIDFQARLNQFDEIECSSHGPVFRFLGDGRLAEVEAAAAEERLVPGKQESRAEAGNDSSEKSPSEGFLSKIVKGFK